MTQRIQMLCRSWWLVLAVAVLTGVAPDQVSGASVGPAGYTNDFAVQPPATDWATVSIAGGAGDTYDLDADVIANTGITGLGVATQTTPGTGAPPNGTATALWHSTAFYLQLRPTQNRYTVLMGKFVNETGTNATEIGISYLLTIAGGANAEESGKGMHVYYSLSGTAGSWTTLGALNSLAAAGSSTLQNTNLAVNWTNGGALYLVWADDNANPGTDTANQIDDFTLRVTAGSSLVTDLTLDLVAPTNGASFASGSDVQFSATVQNGTAPHTVEYFTNSGPGNTVFASAGASATPPFAVTVAPVAGTYNVYAVVTDGAATPAGTNSMTNTFTVIDPIALVLTAPAQDASIDNATPVIATATVAGGTPPYSVQFSLDGVSKGTPDDAPPFAMSFGVLAVGDHTISAILTDANGWRSNAAVHTIHITGPLAVTLAPADGSSFNFGHPLEVSAVGGGGTAPYSVAFYLDGTLAGVVAAPPFTTNFGVLPVGNYALSARITDSATPAPQQVDSGTNGISILPNPILAVVTNPTNGQTAIAGQPLVLSATISVGTPVMIASVEFFFDGVSVGSDSNPPFSATVNGTTPGSHTVHVVATDSLGRTATSATNQVNLITDPLANNNFANRFTLTGAKVTTTGANAGATTEAGEPSGGGGNNRGATLWWTWTAPATGSVRIDTFGSTFNTVLGVYTGTAVNALTQVALNNNAPGFTDVSLVTFNAQQGTVYQIQVGGSAGFGGGNPATGNIQLNIQMPPTVAITSPTAGSTFMVGSNITVTATASSAAGTVSKVDLFRSGVLAGTATETPYTFLVTDAPVGTNAFAAVVTDSIGQVATSAVVNVLVANVGVTIVSPGDGTIFTSTNPISVAAFTLLPSGTITNVEFLVDGQRFANDSTAPFSGVWSNVVAGSHRLAAIGMDDAGNSYTAPPVYVGVAQSIVRSNSVWKYLADGSDQGTAWIAPGFDDSGWTNGPAELGYGDGDEATTVPSGPAGALFITTYFRHAFNVTDTAAFNALSLSTEYDDAAAVYLNGVQVLRTANLPAGAAYNTLATGAAVEDAVATTSVNLTNLLAGTNVFAVEIHQQAQDSSDISFNLQLLGIPAIVRNQFPVVAITNLTNGQTFLGAAEIEIEASASDSDGSVAKVEFFANRVKLGEVTAPPYRYVWATPPTGAYVLTAVATDAEGAATTSPAISIVAYDSIGTPVAAIVSPANGAVMEGPTNLLLTATANALTGVTNVLFLANGVEVGSDETAPYNIVWTSSFLSNGLQAVAFEANGVRGTSPVVTVTITIPPTNIAAPTIASQFPLAGASVTNLTNLTVTFSERVQGVSASDVLLNGTPATGVTGSGSNYVFTFPQPPYGSVEIRWAAGHGITDFGFPTDLPFNELGVDAEWFYTLLDRTPPTVIARTPVANSTVTNLQQVSVTFSEPVTGVDAADLLLGGTPAFGVSGSGTSYTFDVSQPPSGTVSVSWAVTHGITDLADVPNAFNRTGAGATWNFTLDARTVLVQSNSVWRFVKGTNEASEPISAWRQPAFDVTAWGTGPTPFVFGEPAFTNALNPGTDVGEMATNGYTSVFLRREFVVNNAGAITNLLLNHQSDDGFIAWLNGVEVLRYNMPGGEIPYNGGATASITEGGFNGGAPYIVATLSNVTTALVSGTNTLAVQAFNVISTPPSSDFVFNAQLYTFLSDAAVVAPRIVQAIPAAGDVLELSGATIVFSETVTGVDAADLLVNGTQATGLVVSNSTTYLFSFAQPPYGPVVLSWATGHGIQDLDTPAKPFDATAAGSTLLYSLINPSNPRVASQVPPAGNIVTGLTSIVVTFTEPVTGVEAADLLVAGNAAASVTSADNTSYTFGFAQPPYGAVTIRWATNHDIVDLEVPENSFDPTRFGGQWNYALVNPVPTVALTSPTNGVFLQQPANIPLRATATDNDGTVALVEFFQNGTKLGEASATPYSLTWSNVTEGAYSFVAVATDNSGLRGTSAPVNVTVVTNLPIVLTRGPYLQIGSPTGGVVRWRTDIASDAVVRYGTDLFNLTNIAVQAFSTNEHIVPVAGLEPNTKYYYSIGSSSQRLVGGPTLDGTNYWFKTSPVVGTRGPTRVWVLGDSGTAGNGSADRQISTRDAFYNFAATNGRPADLWLMLGDNAYNSGTDAEHQRAIFDIYPATLRNLFLWPTIGNHETSQSYTATDFPYLHIFSLPQSGEAGGVPSGTEKYYSFDYANIHFVCLDSMTSTRSATSAMAQWLENDLETTDQEWVIVYFHHPPYTRGNHNSDAETDLIEVRQNLLPILEANGVDLVLSGHSHAWERSYLLHGHYGNSSTLTESMKVDGGDGREGGTGAYRKNARGEGVVYTVAGNAGQITGGQLNHPAHFLSLNELGTMVIDVTSNRLEATFVRENSLIRDRFTLVKPDFKPATPANLVAIPVATDTISLAWTDAADNELGYLIERSLDGTNFTQHLAAPANATNALDAGLLANATYYYRVRATNSASASDYSNIASATTTIPSGLPNAPIGLVAKSDNGLQFYRTQMILSWLDRSTNEAIFSVERSLDGSTFTAVGTVAANIAHFVDRGLESGTPYFYRVRAVNLLGASPASNLAGDVTHPQGQLAAEGATVVFHGGMDGAAPVAYQWRFRDMPIFGETNETLVLANIQITDEGEYTVAVTDGNGRTVSNPAYLFVLSPPRIVFQPLDTTNHLGSTAGFSVVASGTDPFTYSWRKNGALLVGANAPTLTFTNVQPAQEAGYDVIVANEFGSITSRLAQLVVNLPPIAVADLVYRFPDEDVAIEIEHLLANDGDPDGDLIALVDVVTNTTHGAAVQVSGRYVFYTPPAGYVGPDSFLYTIADVHGAAASALVSIEISSNTPPVIAVVSDLIASVLTPVIITNLASDADLPANKLSFELIPASPAVSNAAVRGDRNAFVWTPTREQAPSTNIFTVEVADDGKPSLSSRRSFKVVVRDYVELSAGASVVRAGDATEFPVAVFSSAGLTELQFLVRYPQGRIQDLTVAPLAPQVRELIVQPAGPDLAQLTFRANATDPLRGTQQLARFSFVASPGQVSAFLPFEMQNVTVRRAVTGLTPSSLVNHGRVTVVGGGSLLEARLGTNGARDLILYGPTGVHYFIESTTNHGPDAVWSPWRDLTTTNLSNWVPISDPPVPFILFRARE